MASSWSRWIVRILVLAIGTGLGEGVYRPEAAAAPASLAKATPKPGQVELVLLISPQTGLTAPQTWARALGEAGITRVQIRQARADDHPAIHRMGQTEPPVYVVTGILTADEVLLPGARFRMGEVRGLARWLEELAVQGPPDQRPPKAAFGLVATQFQQIYEDLTRPVGWTTRGLDRVDAVRRIGQKLQFPFQPAPDRLPGLAGDKVSEELTTFSSGTALAYLLRPAGYALVPRCEADRIYYALERMRPGMDIWPVGWPPEKLPKDILPQLFEFLDVHLEKVSATEALRAIADRLKVPYLLDYNALARHGIEPEKTAVSIPTSRTYYSKVLDRVLFQAGLKYELRLDEAGQPFLWITTVKPL